MALVSRVTCYLGDGVVGPVDGGAGGAVDEEWEVALLLVLDHQLLQLGRDHLASATGAEFSFSFSCPTTPNLTHASWRSYNDSWSYKYYPLQSPWLA